MLHKYEKIDEAMSACVALEYPLMVILHGKQPTALYNADEATRGTSTGSVARTYSFLPPSYNTGTSHASASGSNSLFTDDTVPFEATLMAPSQDAANANAALGYLMRPANLSAAAAADRAEVAKAVADGEELTLVHDFPLGSLQGGAAQREALLVALLESRLGSVTLLHLIEEGTPAYDSFTSAVPVPNTTGGSGEASLPRVHIFYAPTIGLSPMVLQGAALTPQNLHSCVQMSMLRPRSGAGSGAAAATPGARPSPASGLRSFFSDSVAAMNKEYERSRHQSSSASSPTPQRSEPTAAAAATVASSPAVRATGVSRADALAAAHLISLAGLPTCFATGPIPGASVSSSNSGVKKILTTPAMTMQTVWRAVEKHLGWAQHEVQQAQAASMWNGVTPPKPGAAFTLTVRPTSASNDDAVVEVKSMKEAAAVRLQDFPANTVVQVSFDGAAPMEAPTTSAAAPASPPQQQQQQASSASDFVCEGDVCRRRQPGEAPTTVPTATPAGVDQAAAGAAAPPVSAVATAGVPAPSASAVKLHCSLPNGTTLDVAGLDPSTATLQADVRPPVEAALGHGRFVFVCAYPPKRYSVEEDEPRVLRDIGLGRSSALRVVALDGPGSPNAAAAPGQPTQTPAGPTRQMLANAASSLLGMFGGRRPSGEAGAAASSANSGPSSSSSAAPPPRRAFTSMAQMLAAGEEEERATAVERLRQEQQRQQQDPADAEQRLQGKKSNRYFGGVSTEYVAEDNDDAEGKKGGVDPMTGMSAEQQGIFLREQLQRLMRQQRRNMGEGGDEGDEEAEEEEGEGAPQQQQQRGAAGRGAGPRAFQGQGRRLAGNAPPSASNEPVSATPPAASSPADTSDAKKNQ